MVNWKKLSRSIPHRVQVSPKGWYEILWVDDFKDGKTLGETRFDPKQIVLMRGQSPKMTVSVYLHEYAHAYSHEWNLNLTESQVLAFEKGLYFWLKHSNLFTKGKRNAKKA
jgi:hypothetical protein